MAKEFSFEDFTKPSEPSAGKKEFSYEDFSGSPPESSAVGAFTRGAVRGILPAAAGIIGGSAAAVPGSIAGPVGSFAAGLAGGAAAAGATSAAQEAFLRAHPDLSNTLGLGEEQARADEAQHPYASFIGNIAPNMAALRPTGALFKSAKGLTEEAAKKLAAEKTAAAVTGAVGAGVGGGMEAGQQAFGEEPMDWTKVGLATAAGALGQKETAVGKRLVAIGQKPFANVKAQGEDLAKTAIKEAEGKQAEKTKEETTNDFTSEPAGTYKVKVNGKEGILQVNEDGTQTFNGQPISPAAVKKSNITEEPRINTDSSPAKPLNVMPEALKNTESLASDEGVDYGSIDSVNAHIKKIDEAYRKSAYEDPEEVMGTPDRPEATPIENTEEFPLSEEQISEKAGIEKENKENEKQIKQLAKETKKVGVAKGSDNLWNTLKNKLTPGEVSTLGGKSKTFTNRYMGLKAKGNAGTDLSTPVSDGRLDDFLPPEYRSAVTSSMNAAELGDAESAAVEYIREKILSGNYLTHNADISIKKNGHQMEHLEEAIKRNLTTKDINELLEEAANEQRELDLSAEKPTAETQAGIAESIPTEETAPGAPKPAVSSEPETFTLEGYTPDQIKALEAARESREAEEAAKNKAQDEADRKAREQQDIKNRNEAASDQFKLGQSAEDNLSGQKDIFGDESSKEHPEWATQHEPEIGGQVVYSDADSALMRGHSSLTGQNVYVGIDRATGNRTLTDIDSFNGKWMGQKLVDRLRNEKTKAVAADKAKQSKFPNGPFQGAKDNVVGSKNVDPKYVGMLSQLTKKMGLGDVKIFLLHPTDVRNNADEYHLHGDYSSAMSVGLDAGEDGSARAYGPNRKDFYISVNPGMSEGRTVETIAHELGHIVERVAFNNAPEATRSAIKAEFEKWLMDNRGGTAKELIHSLRNRESAEAHAKSVAEDMSAANLTKYWKSFSEWFADNTSRWATTAEKPVGIVEKFFADLGRKLREYVGILTGKKYAPAKTVAEFLDKMGTGAADEWFKDVRGRAAPEAKSMRPEEDHISQSKSPSGEESIPTENGADAIQIMNELNRRPPEKDPAHIEKVKAAYQNAIDNPSTTAKSMAEGAKKFIQHWSDKTQGWIFSADAPLNNAIRRAIMESTELDMPEKAKALMSTSMSQTVHADAVSSMFLHDGDIRYDKDLSKWVAEKSEYTFRSLADKLNDMAKSNGLNIQQAEHMFHTATEARRLKDWISENDNIDSKIAESKAKVKELMTQAARELGKNIDLIGDLNPQDLIKSKSLKEAAKIQGEIKNMSSQKRMIHSMDPTVEGKPDLNKVKADIAKAEELFKKMPELDEAVKVWNGIRRNAIEKLVETGLWTGEEANRMYDNINYVPFFREEQIENNAGPKEFLNGLQVQAKERRASGSYAPVNDIFDNMVRWTQYAINRSVRNQSSLNLIDAANAFDLAHKIPAPKRGLNVTRVWRDGKQEFWHMEDPMFVDAFHGLEGVSIPTFKAASAFANVLRKSIVMNPIFATSQVFQDSFAAIITSGLKPQYALKIPARAVLEYVRTLRNASKTHEELKRYGAVGVKDYSSTATRTDAKIYAGVQPPPGGWGKVKNTLEHISMASDNAVRQAVYQAVMEAKGNNPAARSEAIEKAFEVINFRRRGSSKMMMIGGQLIPFFNAYLAAQNVAIKTLSGTGLSPVARKEAYKTLAQTTGSVIALSVLYSMLNANDEDYLKKPATVRDRLLVIPGTGGFSIPLRNDVFTMPKIIAEHMYLLMTNNATEDPRKFRDSMASAIVSSVAPPTAVPQAVKPLVEVGLNYDFFQQKPLIGTFQQGLDVSRQFNDSTSEFSRVLGKTGMIAPINADHLIRGMTGSVGGLFLMLTNPIIHHDANVERPTLSWNDWMASVPGNSAFMSRDNQNGLKKDFYVLKEAVDRSSATFNDIKKRTPSEAAEYMKSPEHRIRVGMHSEVDRIGKNLTTIRQNIALISNMPESKISSEEKDRRIKNLQTQEDVILKNINVKKLRSLAQL